MARNNGTAAAQRRMMRTALGTERAELPQLYRTAASLYGCALAAGATHKTASSRAVLSLHILLPGVSVRESYKAAAYLASLAPGYEGPEREELIALIERAAKKHDANTAHDPCANCDGCGRCDDREGGLSCDCDPEE